MAVNTPAAKAAQQATRTIPIVANMGDPVELGLAARLAAPGGNITGVSGQFGATAGKRLELLKEAVPRASRVAVLWNAANPNKALGIAEEVKPKLKLNRGGHNAEFVARGEADLAIQLAHEILAVPGIEFLPLPSEFQRTFVFSAGLSSRATGPGASKALLQFLSGPAAATVIRAKGMEPMASK